MCASYGLTREARRQRKAERDRADPFAEPEYFNEKVRLDLDGWIDANDDNTIRPTGKNARNYNPIITAKGLELSWWTMWERNEETGFDELTPKDTINAKIEHIRRGLWHDPFNSGRVLVPMSEYYEYRKENGRNVRYAFRVDDEPIFAIAGIAAPLNPEPDDAALFDDRPPYPDSSYALVTRPPTPYAGEIHNRMLLLLPPSFYDIWLDPDTPGDSKLREAALAASEGIVDRLVYEPI